jgi:hypothetical protein
MRMTLAARVLVVLLAAAFSGGAMAQWKWRDRSGVMQYSDVPPPQGTPDKDVLERPRAFDKRLAVAASSASAPAAASAPRAGLEPELEAQRRKLEVERADKASKDQAAQRAEEQRVAALRADNCLRARSSLRSLEEGQRLVRTNAQGEREVLDDKARAEEMTRARGTITTDCR